MSSNYPEGTWGGDPRAPWNQEEPTHVCERCMLCKDVRAARSGLGLYVGTCVREVWEAEGEEELEMAEVSTVDLAQEACEHFIEVR